MLSFSSRSYQASSRRYFDLVFLSPLLPATPSLFFGCFARRQPSVDTAGIRGCVRLLRYAAFAFLRDTAARRQLPQCPFFFATGSRPFFARYFIHIMRIAAVSFPAFTLALASFTSYCIPIGFEIFRLPVSSAVISPRYAAFGFIYASIPVAARV